MRLRSSCERQGREPPPDGGRELEAVARARRADDDVARDARGRTTRRPSTCTGTRRPRPAPGRRPEAARAPRPRSARRSPDRAQPSASGSASAPAWCAPAFSPCTGSCSANIACRRARVQLDDGRRAAARLAEVRDRLARDAHRHVRDELAHPRAGGDDDDVCFELVDARRRGCRSRVAHRGRCDVKEGAASDIAERTMPASGGRALSSRGRNGAERRASARRQPIVDAALLERVARRQVGGRRELDEPDKLE